MVKTYYSWLAPDVCLDITCPAFTREVVSQIGHKRIALFRIGICIIYAFKIGIVKKVFSSE